MNKFNIINLNEFTWQLNIAIMGGTFAVFSLVFDEKYIYYGLVTFAFGVTTHVFYKFFEWIFRKDGTANNWYWITHMANVFFVFAWIKVLLCVY